MYQITFKEPVSLRFVPNFLTCPAKRFGPTSNQFDVNGVYNNSTCCIILAGTLAEAYRASVLSSKSFFVDTWV